MQNCDFTGNTIFEQVWSKNQNCQFKLNVGTYTNSNKQNSMMVFTFSTFYLKCPIWANLVPKLSVLSWNLVPRLIQYAKFNSSVHFFCFRPEIPFLGKLVPKFQIVCLSWNLVPRLIWICRIQWWCSRFLCQTRNAPF